MAASIPQLRDDLARAGAENSALRARVVELESRPPVIVTREVENGATIDALRIEIARLKRKVDSKPVPKTVVKTVVKEVPVDREVIKTVTVEVPVDRIVTREVIKHVDRIIPRDVIKEIHVDNPDHIAMIRSLQAKLRAV